MNGTRFELDEQKASKLSGMSVSEVWDFINQKAKAADLIVVKNGEYHAKGNSKDQSNLAIFIFDDLIELSWFTKSVKSWHTFYNDKDCEDVIAIFKNKNKYIWE